MAMTVAFSIRTGIAALEKLLTRFRELWEAVQSLPVVISLTGVGSASRI
jgi:hypothetical protein